ncbi:MAG: hypothetical protein ACI9Y1_001810 [Lentisphaeria bacterium]|jgi:hypothetical protein
MEGSYGHPDGNTALTTYDSILISEEFTTNISESTISAGSIDISGVELATVSASIMVDKVTYSSEILVINGDSAFIERDEISFELENGDEGRTNCSI